MQLHRSGQVASPTADLEPRVLHDLRDGNSLVGVGRQHAAEQVSALGGDMRGLLKVSRNNSWEHLLEPHQVVATVITPLGEWEHACKFRDTRLTGAMLRTGQVTTFVRELYGA